MNRSTLKRAIEKRTGILWGTFRSSLEPASGALFYLRIGGPAEYCRIEAGIKGRCGYITWGH